MVTRAIVKYIRVTPRKFRLVIPLVKGRNPEEALQVLMTVKKGAAKYASDLIRSAIANAKQVKGVDIADLYISRMTADCGPTLKRFRAGSMGRASTIRKHTSHITVELDHISNRKESPRRERISAKEQTKGAHAAGKAPHAEGAHTAKKPKAKATKIHSSKTSKE